MASLKVIKAAAIVSPRRWVEVQVHPSGTGTLTCCAALPPPMQAGLPPCNVLLEEATRLDGIFIGFTESCLAEVLVSKLHTLDILLLLHQHVTVLEELLDGHLGLLEGRWALPGVDEPLADVLHSGLGDPLADLVVVHPGTQGTEEVDGLPREGVDELGNGLVGDAVGAEDTLADTDPVLAGGSPVDLLHTTVTDEWRVQGGEVVAGDDDGHTGVLLLVVHAGELHVGGVVGDVHEGGVHHLVVDGVLGGAAHATSTGVEIVDEEAAHLALLDDVRSLTVPLPDELGWLSGVAALQLSGAHHDGGDAHLGEDKLTLEGFSLTLASPDTQDEWHLDAWQGHDVLGEVVNGLDKEGLG
ncbi:hypothetical protein A7M47_17960 [Acinetobacter baumannii]|nr:hypothetical protein A7M47_17960 [Acinetobacter baumannii]